jgi:arginine exporter protein ArgO
MKPEKTFTASRLRSNAGSRWQRQAEIAVAAVLCCFAILLAMAGMASFLGHPSSLPWLSSFAPLSLLIGGVFLLWLGVLAWRIGRIRQHQRELYDARHPTDETNS